ncbi:MAG: hypothetical protein AB7J32_14765 [Pseudonocardia sp.]
MAEKTVTLQLPADLVERLPHRLGGAVELQSAERASDLELEAIVPDGMKKVIGGAILVTVILKGAGAAVELATAINEYVDETGESVQVVDPEDGSLVREIVPGIDTQTIARVLAGPAS